MSLTRANGGMFGLKLVGSNMPAYPFFGRAGQPALMNFPDSDEGRRVARLVPIGHRSLVYLMAPVMRIWAAIEYISFDPKISDVLEDGRRAAEAQRAIDLMRVVNSHFATLWRCTRIVAVNDDPRTSPPVVDAFHQGDVMFDMDERDYVDRFDAIPWTWKDER